MALSLKRFVVYATASGVAAALAGRAIVAAAREDFLTYESEYVQSQVGKARSTITNLSTTLAILELRDSVARALRARPSSPGLTVVLPARATRDQTRAIDSTVRATWQWLTPGASEGSTVFLAIDDSPTSPANLTPFDRFVTLFLPEELDGRTCVMAYSGRSIGPLGTGVRRAASRDSLLAYLLRTSSGPCATIARYGPPGPGTGSWLRSEAWTPAWIPPQEPLAPPRRSPQATPSARFAWRGEGVQPWFDETGRGYGLSGDLLACLAARETRCDALLHSSSAVGGPGRSTRLPRGILRHYTSWDFNLRFGTIAYIERELGPERFTAFWRSAKPPEAALAELHPDGTFGVLGAAMRKDMQRYKRTAWPTAFEWGVFAVGFLVTVGPTLGRARRRFLEL